MATRDQLGKRIAIYCRVSTDEQAKEGVSLDEQQVRLHAYCRAMGWTAAVEEFVDDGYSAKNMDRPALKRLLEEIRRGVISKLMVTKLDRLSRRLLDLLTLIELFQQHGVSFVSTSESFDTETPAGRLTLQVLGAVAEFERERIRERVFDNMLYAARSGRWLTQHPYGYRLEDKALVVYEPEANIVRRVFRMFAVDGLGYLAIARRLNEERIPSRHNKQWSIRGVKRMLTNPAYIGTLVWNRVDSSNKQRQVKLEDDWVVIPDSHPAIIDHATWNQVQQRIEKTAPVPPRAKGSPHLLGGLLKCGRCGSAMTIGWSGWPTRYRVYRCSAYSNKGTCQSKPYPADEVEQWFKEGLRQFVEPVDHTEQEVIVQGGELDLRSRRLQRIEAAKRRYQRQVGAYTAGLIELEDLAKEREQMERDIAALCREQETGLPIVKLREVERDLNRRVLTAGDAIGLLPVELAKAKLRTLIRQVRLYDREIMEIDFNLDILKGSSTERQE